jgi:hypothetical protein
VVLDQQQQQLQQQSSLIGPHGVNHTLRAALGGPVAGPRGTSSNLGLAARGAVQLCAASQHHHPECLRPLAAGVPVSYVAPATKHSPRNTNAVTANATGLGGWTDALAKAKAFVAKLTPEEKALMVTGYPGPCVGNILAIPRLNFPGLCLQDGPLAIRVADYASVFAAGVTVAASWDRSLMHERGRAMGEEFRGKGAQILLG